MIRWLLSALLIPASAGAQEFEIRSGGSLPQTLKFLFSFGDIRRFS
jgi:hypothetical protein